eukprot:10827462-Heterocapsa_arctica.AAC.1
MAREARSVALFTFSWAWSAGAFFSSSFSASAGTPPDSMYCSDCGCTVAASAARRASPSRDSCPPRCPSIAPNCSIA